MPQLRLCWGLLLKGLYCCPQYSEYNLPSFMVPFCSSPFLALSAATLQENRPDENFLGRRGGLTDVQGLVRNPPPKKKILIPLTEDHWFMVEDTALKHLALSFTFKQTSLQHFFLSSSPLRAFGGLIMPTHRIKSLSLWEHLRNALSPFGLQIKRRQIHITAASILYEML